MKAHNNLPRGSDLSRIVVRRSADGRSCVPSSCSAYCAAATLPPVQHWPPAGLHYPFSWLLAGCCSAVWSQLQKLWSEEGFLPSSNLRINSLVLISPLQWSYNILPVWTVSPKWTRGWSPSIAVFFDLLNQSDISKTSENYNCDTQVCLFTGVRHTSLNSRKIFCRWTLF